MTVNFSNEFEKETTYQDACVIVVYQCTNCMELKADYNQG